jgi:hypothetical protein
MGCAFQFLHWVSLGCRLMANEPSLRFNLSQHLGLGGGYRMSQGIYSVDLLLPVPSLAIALIGDFAGLSTVPSLQPVALEISPPCDHVHLHTYCFRQTPRGRSPERFRLN